MANSPKRGAKDEVGQAVVEYIIMLAVALSIVTIIATTFRGTVMKLWTMMKNEISAACPGCPPPQADPDET